MRWNHKMIGICASVLASLLMRTAWACVVAPGPYVLWPLDGHVRAPRNPEIVVECEYCIEKMRNSLQVDLLADGADAAESLVKHEDVNHSYRFTATAEFRPSTQYVATLHFVNWQGEPFQTEIRFTTGADDDSAAPSWNGATPTVDVAWHAADTMVETWATDCGPLTEIRKPTSVVDNPFSYPATEAELQQLMKQPGLPEHYNVALHLPVVQEATARTRYRVTRLDADDAPTDDVQEFWNANGGAQTLDLRRLEKSTFGEHRRYVVSVIDILGYGNANAATIDLYLSGKNSRVVVAAGADATDITPQITTPPGGGTNGGAATGGDAASAAGCSLIFE